MTLLARNSLRLDHPVNYLVLPMGLQVFRLKATALRPSLSATLINPDGSRANLTGATVSFRMRYFPSRRTAIADQPAVVVSAPEGRVRYDWQPGETAVAAEFEAWFVVDHAGGQREFFPSGEALKVVLDP